MDIRSAGYGSTCGDVRGDVEFGKKEMSRHVCLLLAAGGGGETQSDCRD